MRGQLPNPGYGHRLIFFPRTYWFVRAARSRNFNLPDRDRLFGFHLEEEDAIPLVGLHFGNARRNRTADGNVSVCSCHDCTESGYVRRWY